MDRIIDEGITVDAAFTAVRDLLEHEPWLVLGGPPSDDAAEGRTRRAVTEIGLELGGGTRALQEIVVELDLSVDDHGPDVSWPLRWHPTGHTRLLPSFDGVLRAVDDGAGGADLRVQGTYRPPLGTVGAAGDAVVGRRVARASARSLLGHLADRCVLESGRREVVRAGPLPSNYCLIDPWLP